MGFSGKSQFIIRVLLCICLSCLTAGCMNRLFFAPDATLEHYHQPSNVTDYENVCFKSADGVLLHGWFFPAAGTAFGTVIHFHGNFGNIAFSYPQASWLPEAGFNLFTFDYRGYGRSEGAPTRKGLYKDAVAAVKYIQARKDADGNNIFIFGQSLGGAVAIAALAKNDFPGVRAAAFEGVFSSYRREARDMMAAHVRKRIGRMPCLTLQLWPVSFLAVTDDLRPADLIAGISPIPVLIIHGTADDIVSYDHAETLYDRAGAPKALWTIPGGKHLTTFTSGPSSDDWRKKLAAFFKRRRTD